MEYGNKPNWDLIALGKTVSLFVQAMIQSGKFDWEHKDAEVKAAVAVAEEVFRQTSGSNPLDTTKDIY